MKLPNGYGSVFKQGGKRREPWAVRKTDGWEWRDASNKVIASPSASDIESGKVKLKRRYKYIGTYKTKQEALQALANYNRNPLSLPSDITFEEVYARWSIKKFEEIDQSNINGYRSAFKTSSSLHKMQFCDIKLSHLQGVVDTCGKNPPSLKKLKTLFRQLFDYAVKNDIISRDHHIVDYVDVGKSQKSTKHYRFTNAEIDIMWQWSANNIYVQLILMLIYTGVRPGELFALKKSFVNLEEKTFFVEKGKNDNATRIVPIHDKILPFFANWMDKNDSDYLITPHNGKHFKFDTNHGQYTDSYWTPVLSEMGILNYVNEKGELQQHLPDDIRHTFTTRWKEKQLDEAMRRKIQGHSGKGIGEIVYTHFDLEKLREEINKF